MNVQAQRLNEVARLPGYAHPGDAGMDVYSSENRVVQPGEIAQIKTGIALALPAGYVALVKDKSGLALKGIHCLAGVIDAHYRGEYQIVLINHGKQAYEIHAGEKIAQILIQRVEHAELEEVPALSETERGRGGFGSTGLG